MHHRLLGQKYAHSKADKIKGIEFVDRFKSFLQKNDVTKTQIDF